jgi:hypothetical protein
MKRLFTALAALLAVVYLAANLAAQTLPSQELDKDIAAAEKRLNELKQKKRDELQKRIQSLQAELDNMSGEGTTTPNAPPAPSPDSRAAGQPDAAITGRGHGGGEDNAGRDSAGTSLTGVSAVGASSTGRGASGAAVVSAAVQTDNKCLQASTGAIKLNRFDQAICDLAQHIVENNPVQLRPNQEMGILVPLLAGQVAKGGANASLINTAVRDFVIEAEPLRNDKQIGADSESSGTTSLAVKGGIPSVLGWATEHGAAVASRDGTTVTFRFNPVGIVEALSGQGFISSYQSTENDPLVKFFRNTSVGVTFDTTRGTDPPTLIGSKQQVSAFSFRYQFVNQRDPRNKRYREDWKQFISEPGLFFTNTASDALIQLEQTDPTGFQKFRNPDLQQWVNDTVAAVAAKQTELMAMKAVPLRGEQQATEEVRKIIEQQLASLPADTITKDDTVVGALNSYVNALVEYTAKKNELLDKINKGTVISFEYTNRREVNAPDLSNFRFIAERGTVGGLDFTGNASVTIFNKRPADADAKRIKDFNFALQLDKRLKNTMGLGDSSLSFAGKFERVMSNAVALDGTVLPNTKGDIAVGQIKLTIPLGQTGIKLPFSVTFANRTELLREKEVRGNFGFTLDFDSLFARFKPF